MKRAFHGRPAAFHGGRSHTLWRPVLRRWSGPTARSQHPMRKQSTAGPPGKAPVPSDLAAMLVCLDNVFAPSRRGSDALIRCGSPS